MCCSQTTVVLELFNSIPFLILVNPTYPLSGSLCGKVAQSFSTRQALRGCFFNLGWHTGLAVIKSSLLTRRILWVVALAVAVYLVFLLSQLNYLLFHTFAEIITSTVAVAVFFIAWNSRKIVRNDFLMFLGAMLLFVAFINSLHTLAYHGMFVFTNFHGADLAAQFWLISRYLLALSLIISPIFLIKKFTARLVIPAYSLFVGFLLLTVFYWRNFPTAYIDGVGLTEFKIVSEYLIIFLFLIAGSSFYYCRRKLNYMVYRNLLIFVALSIICELFFTIYFGVYDPFNYLGHIAGLISYYFLYKAVVEVSLAWPYALLFRQLRLANSRKDEFIRFLGHELRTPLTTIKLYSEMLESDLAGGAEKEQAEMAKKISQQTDIIQLLVSDLVDVSQIERGTIKFEMMPVDINRLVYDCVAMAKKIYQGKEIEFNLVGLIDKQVLADPRRLMQVLANLIGNGVKYSQAPIKITVRMETSDKRVRISVSDNGAGIAPDKLDKIFDKYYRTEEGKNKAKGLGLGLYLAREIIKKHRGQIEVESKVGEGSTFTIYLPIML